jgi:NAD(P)-dependent dehydrogenase (short-subunit alcohol dehydrogenase family)
MADALCGRTAVVTGGAGGIGKACARVLLRDGASVLIMGRSQAALERARDELQAEAPAGAVVAICRGDATAQPDVQAAFEQAHALQGRLDILVATVGGGDFKPLLMQDAEGFRAELDGNLTSAFLAIRYGAPLMGQGGAIVCISSTAAAMPFPWLAAYCAAKAGLESLVRTAADELASAGIRVNAVRPGMTRSQATGAMFDDPQVIGRFLEQIPLGRGGDPQDTAGAVRYLAGPESSWVTGQSFAVDGGHELRRNPDLSGLIAAVYGEDALAAVRAGRPPSRG